MRVGMLFSSAPSPRPSRPYSARPRLYAFPVGEGREMRCSRGRVPGRPGEFPYPWEPVPIPRVVRRRSAVSLSVLGEAWEKPHRPPLNSYLEEHQNSGGWGVTPIDAYVAQPMEQTQVPRAMFSRVRPGLCPGNTVFSPQGSHLLNPRRLYGAGHQRSPPRTWWSS